MSDNQFTKPTFLFEVSWEICNKVGGIYTVISTKAPSLCEELGDNYMVIGPDVWKETRENPDFTEDLNLYKLWRTRSAEKNLHFRIGRWNIPGNPIAILVDFTSFFPNKDAILFRYWEKFKLDSISGQWDYIEPALFGHAAATVIESFYEYHLTYQDKIVAHFHEWMTGAGVLHLKDAVPQVATIFTTHATVVGRTISSNGLDLYNSIGHHDANMVARTFNVFSKHSLEKCAATEADAFTTVSSVTDTECTQFLGRKVDVITPNGFDQSFVPQEQEFDNTRNQARLKLLEVAGKLLQQPLPDDSTLVLTSGRYEFRNKGIDLFIDAMGKIARDYRTDKTIVAYIMVPAHQSGARKELITRLGEEFSGNPLQEEYLTHGLFDYDNDAIIRRIRENGLRNSLSDRVKIIFVPAYLNGNDGIFNMDYYELLPGFDLTLFPSYYEPWGYTPLESIAFQVPTVTTSLSGFSQWVLKFDKKMQKGVMIIDRTYDDYPELIQRLYENLTRFIEASPAEVLKMRKAAFELSEEASWESLVTHYWNAFEMAINKADSREDLYKSKMITDQVITVAAPKKSAPQWRKVYVNIVLPDSLKGLLEMSKNLWWSWNYEAIELFELIDKELWEELNNPIALLESLNIHQIRNLEKNPEFLERYTHVYDRFTKYMADAADKPKDMVAYFSMEYGLHDSIKIYSGGLGMLAGDYLKEASDSNKNLIGIGLLYRYGYFKQTINIFGDQIAEFHPQKFTHLPVVPVRKDDGEWLVISLALPGRTVKAKVWRVDVGRIPLYLMDTDTGDNHDYDKSITHQLYGGDWENRLKQELLLGVGGYRIIKTLNLKPALYHMNEGHAAFLTLERLRELVQERNLSFAQACEVVRSSSLFTTHTPVPAGHDAFSEDLLRAYIPHYAERINIDWNDFMNLGKFNENDPNEKFSMSVLAVRLSQEVNGVSKIHGRVSREMFQHMFDGFFPQELHISHVTNGVHFSTWTHPLWQKLYDQELGSNFKFRQDELDLWKRIKHVEDEKIWNIRKKIKHELFDYLGKRISKDMNKRHEDPKYILNVLENFNPDALTIGFARRFATYKRAHLLFTNLDTLAKILNIPGKPVQFLYAGKAHPHDKAGQDLIKRIIEVSRMPQFAGKIIFIENYDMPLGAKLVQGVDIWLNTPTRPLEASGTSGEKAVMNGVVNFSVLDGWWAEGYKPGAGWALSEARTYVNQQFQDILDSEAIYNILEDEIIPIYYDRGTDGIPRKWISYIKNTIAAIAPDFTMKRMIDDYYNQYYTRMIERAKQMNGERYEGAREVANWKSKMIKNWDNIEVIHIDAPDSTNRPLSPGENFKAEIVLDTHDISSEHLAAEVLFGHKVDNVVEKLLFHQMMHSEIIDRHTVRFFCDIPPFQSGVYDFVFRIVPQHPSLPHRQDFMLMKWV